MNKSRLFKRLLFAVLLMMLTSVSMIAQVFNANFQPVNFGGTGVTITNKVGTGTAVNNKVLYQNVITVGTQQIDAIVTTLALNNVGTFTAFDQTGTGTGYTNNLPQWFSPQFNFGTGGGSAQFRFEFIIGGSYNNTTNTGTPVTLQNVKINTYDIDGNGTTGTNQFNEFGGFITYELGNPTNLAATYNSTLSLTKFRSGSSTNTTDPNDEKNRVRVTYASMNNFTISVGAEGSGLAYFFLDFSVGPAFSTAVLTSAPNLDLNTSTTGINNSSVFSGNSTVNFTTGATNITSTGTTLDDIKVSFTSSMLQNGASELLLFNGASSGGTIPLNFAHAASITNLTVGGVTYAITASVATGISSLTFAKSGGGTITLAQAEAFVDAMRYQNTAATPSSGTRTFDIAIRDGSLSSPVAQYTTQLYIHSCPSVDSRNNGNGQASQCAGVGSNAMAPGFQYTTYATVPTASKTGDIVFRWATLPSIIPAITKVWINGSLSAAQVGPASPSTISGTNYLIKYCFYNVNLPPAGVYTLELTDPSTGAILGRCTYTGNTNIVTTEPTLSNGGPLSVNTVSITNTDCSSSANGSATVQGVDGVPPYRYNWSPSGGTSATATGLVAGTYYCTVTDTANTSVIDTVVIAADNITPTVTATTPANRCGTGTLTLGATASAGTINWYAAATGGTSLGTGTSYTTPSISATTTYYVDATATGCTTATRTAVVATVNAVPSISGVTDNNRCGTGMVTLGAAASAGTINWYAASTGGTSLATGTSYTTPSISTTTTYYVDATANGCTTATRSAVVATVNAVPSISGVTDNNRCGTGTVTLGAAASAGTINWYAASTGGTSLATGTSYTTPSISATTTYYVDATANGCATATRTAVVATVNAIPSISGVTDNNRCGTGTVTLGAAASTGTINWYAASTGGTSLATGTSYTTPSISTTTTYYVDATANGCTTATRSAVVATVNAVPSISGVTDNNRCGTGTVTLGAAASAGTINWYAASTGGTSLATGTSYTTPSISATTTYYVDATANGCATATRTAVVATVNAIPSISGVTDNNRCGTGTVTIGAAASSGTINWYAASTGGTSLATGTSYTTPSISATTTYYVDATATGCTTATRTAVVATVNPVLTASVSVSASTTSVCGSNPITFTATPTNGGTTPVYQWKLNGVNVGTNSSTYVLNSPVANDSVNVVMTSNATPCLATASVNGNGVKLTNATITPAVSISANPGNTVCAGTSVTFTATPVNGGSSPVYQWKNKGVNIGTNSNSYSSASLTTNDSIYVILTSNATCLSTTTATSSALLMTVNAIPSISGTTPANRCGSGTVTLGAAASAGTINWYAASTGGTSLATGTPYTTPSISATTTYYVDATANGCTTASRTSVVATVNAIPTISGTTDNSRCGSGTVTIGAAASAGTINWYAASTGGTSLATGTSYTTPSISATTTYYVDATANGCTTATRTAVVATVNAIPSISGVTDNNRCGTGTVTLGAAASTGTINWYAASTGGTSLATGTSYTTPSISTTTTYYVDATANGCTTATRSAVIATINVIPSISSTTDNNRCGTGTVTLGAAASAGTINWYAASTGGTSLATGTSYTTPSISATTTYYVDATANGCTTATRSAVIATINVIPSISSTTDNNRCGTGTVTLGAAASAGTINWYAASTGGTSLATGTSYTTPSISATTTYYVDATANGCTTASRTAVVATVNAIPSISGTTDNNRCGTGTVTLGAAASTGTINWYAASTGGTSLATGTSYTTPSISTTTTYYVDATANGCATASRTAVVATVNTIPTISGTTPSSVCGSGTVVLGAAASAGTINWYAAATGGTSLGTGTTYTTPSISATTTYYVDATATGCTTATRTAVVATVNAIPSISGVTDNNRCGTGTVTLGAAASTGTINWYAASTGGTSLATGTSYTTPSISTTTTYYVDATANGCTTASRTAVLATVNPVLTASVSVSASTTSVCGSSPITFTATPTNGGTTPVYQWKLNGVNVGTNSSTYVLSSPVANDSVNVVMTSNATPCLATASVNGNGVKLTNATITPAVSITANPGNTVCAGTSVTFTATPNNGGSTPTYQWYKNSLLIGSNSATYVTTSLNNNDTIKVQLTSNANCLSYTTAISNSLVITVNAKPTISSQPQVQAIISGSTAQYNVVGANVVGYQWQTATLTGSFGNVPNGSVYVGGNTSTLVINNTTGLNNQRYRVVLTNTCGDTYSDTMKLAINIKPDAQNDSLNIVQGGTDSVDVRLNDTDTDGLLSNPTVISGPQHGTTTVTSSGKVTYQPNLGYYGLDTFMYRVCDNGTPVACDTAFVFIKINAAPVANDDTISVNEDDSIVIHVRLNDNDPDGLLNNPVIRTQPNNGSVTINPNGTITFKPNPNFHGLDSFMYRLCDNGTPVLCDSAWVRLNILDVNDGPGALDDTASVNEDDSVTINVRLNDSDVDGTLNNPTIRTNPANGSVVVNTDGTIKYLPNPNYHGLDSFMYRVCDNGTPVLCDSAWVRLNILEVNDGPDALDDTASVNEDDSVTINVRLNDSDLDGTLNNPTIRTNPANGSVVVNTDGTIKYLPNPNYHGLDSFMYRVCDNGTPVLCDSAWVRLNILEVNDGPDALDDTASVNEDDTVTINVRLNDSDLDGTLNNPTIRTNPANGSVVVNTDGTIKYLPNPNYHGLDSFMYRVCDNGTPVLCDSAWVRLNILEVNDGPDALDDTASVNEDDSVTINVRLNDSDLDGTLNNPTIRTNPANGSVVVNADGTIKYLPNPNYHGLDSFMYRVCDNGMPVLCDSAWVHINILAVNDKPIALNDTASTNQNVSVNVNVLANDTDTDGTLNNPTVVIQPLNGTAVVNGNGTVTYTPNANYFGVDSFMYQVCDNGSPVLCDSAWVNITVKSVMNNLAPIAVDDTIRVSENDKVVFNVITNDYDQDGDKLGLPVVIKAPLHGTLLLRADTTFIYIPTTGYTGNDQFTYTITDNGIPSKSDTAIVYIEVVPLVVKVPDGFSPDGDGTNDKFVIPGIEKYPNNKLTIVNRWGDVVYEKSQYQNDWGGEPNKGILFDKGVLPAGNYFYIFETGTTDKAITGSLYINK